MTAGSHRQPVYHRQPHELLAAVGRASTSLPLTRRMAVQRRALATPSRALFPPTHPPPSLRALRAVVVPSPLRLPHSPLFLMWPKNRIDFFHKLAIVYKRTKYKRVFGLSSSVEPPDPSPTITPSGPGRTTRRNRSESIHRCANSGGRIVRIYEYRTPAARHPITMRAKVEPLARRLPKPRWRVFGNLRRNTTNSAQT